MCDAVRYCAADLNAGEMQVTDWQCTHNELNTLGTMVCLQ